MSTTVGWPEPRRLLVRGVNWLGDAVMTVPALQRLRERFPQTRITLLAPQKLAPLWSGHPALDAVLSPTLDTGVWSVARRLQTEHFDTGLVLPNSPRSALELWLARIPRRIGYARPWRNWMLTQAVPARPGRVVMQKRSAVEVHRLLSHNTGPDSAAAPVVGPTAHQAHEYLHLAGVLGANTELAPARLVVHDTELKAACSKFGLEQFLTQNRPVLGLNPGAEYGPAKRWPVERFIAAATELHRRINCTWLIFGGPAEEELTRQIASALQAQTSPASKQPHNLVAKNLAAQTSLRELMALLKMCRVLLTNDTGPMHLAAALGTPVIVPFGSTSPELTGPGLYTNTPQRVLQAGVACAPCFRRVCPVDLRCLTGIGPQAVVAAVLELLG